MASLGDCVREGPLKRICLPLNSGADFPFQGTPYIWEGSIWVYPLSLRISGVWWQRTTSIWGVQRPEGSICGGRMASREAKEPLKRNTPNSVGTPNFIPSQEGKRMRSSKKSGIATLKSLLAREAGQPGTWGNPPPLPALLQLPRVEGAAETCLQPPVPGVLDLHPSISHPGQGSLKEEPPIFIIPAPEPQYLARCSPSAMACASRLVSPWRPQAPSPARRAPSPAPPPPRYWLL